MSRNEPDAVPPRRFTAIPELQELDRSDEPSIAVGDRRVRVTVRDTEGEEIALTFRPYQAVRVTTVDCYRRPAELPSRPRQIHWACSSQWIDELAGRLAELDPGADFMERAVHFLVPAGDDVLEVVAWKVEIERAGSTIVLPAGA